MTPLVAYHKGCRDGFCAAWVAWLAMPEAQFVACSYGDPPVEAHGRDLYILDFSWPRPALEAMREEAASIIILDHHRTAAADLEGFPGATFDMDRSGAGLAWDYFHEGKPRPPIVNYIEDRDLWRFRLPDSRAINAWLSITPFEFGAWSEASFTLGAGTKSILVAGQAIIDKTAIYIREVAKNAVRVRFSGHEMPMVNAPQVDISELLEHLALQDPGGIAMGWFMSGDGRYRYSLRSRGEVDVSELAKRHRGGGHKQAAGFSADWPIHQQWLV